MNKVLQYSVKLPLRKEKWYKFHAVFSVLIVGVLALMIGGCTVTMPSSESMIFREEEPAKADQEGPGVFSKPHQQQYKASDQHVSAGVLSVTGRTVLPNELSYAKDKFARYVQEKKQEPDIQDEDFVIANAHNTAVSIPVSISSSSNLALSGSFGIPVLGVDLTANLLDDTFITANIHYLSGELIVQRKIFQNDEVGIAVGPHFKIQRRWLQVIEGPDESFGLSTIFSAMTPAKTFYNSTLGVRASLHIPVSDRVYLQGMVAPGYVINLQRFTLNLGLSMQYYP